MKVIIKNRGKGMKEKERGKKTSPAYISGYSLDFTFLTSIQISLLKV